MLDANKKNLKVSKELKNGKLDKTTITKNGHNMSGMERLHGVNTE